MQSQYSTIVDRPIVTSEAVSLSMGGGLSVAPERPATLAGEAPCSNTGPLNRQCHADYLVLVLPVVGGYVSAEGKRPAMPARAWEWVLRLGGGVYLDHGLSGYTESMVVLGDGRVMWHRNHDEMGICVWLPGQAVGLCPVPIPELLRLALVEQSGHATRFDVALDSDSVPMSTWIAAAHGGEIVSRAQRRKQYCNWDLVTGVTLDVGSGGSRRSVCIYDKQAEQRERGRTEGDVLSRCEVRFKRDAAQMAAAYVVGGRSLVDLVLSSIDVREVTGGEIEERPRVEWWAQLVAGAERLSFAAAAEAAKCVEDVRAWLRSQVAPLLAVIVAVDGGDLGFVAELVRDGEERWSGKHLVLVSAGRGPHG